MKIDPLNIKLDELELSARTTNVLCLDMGFTTIREVVGLSEQELLRLPNFGRKSLNEIKEVFSIYGVSLPKMKAIPPLERLSALVGRVHATKAAYEAAVRELAAFTNGMAGNLNDEADSPCSSRSDKVD
jgi:hypothetical protein